jgi:hypothetical protein
MVVQRRCDQRLTDAWFLPGLRWWKRRIGWRQTETIMASPAKSKLPKSKLDGAVLLILENAAEREDKLVYPLPESLATLGKEVEKAVKALLARKLIEECPAKLEDAIWRTDEQQRHLTLRLTSAGLHAVGSPSEKTNAVKERPPAAKPRVKASKASSTQKQATKAERILALLRRSQGATIAELTKSTGWQAHSIRGFLAGTLKRKMRLKLKSERLEGKERRYRVA